MVEIAMMKSNEKYKQIKGLGLYNLCIYTGGLFEWLCLQDIYGDDEFLTTGRVEILDYKPRNKLYQHYYLQTNRNGFFQIALKLNSQILMFYYIFYDFFYNISFYIINNIITP